MDMYLMCLEEQEMISQLDEQDSEEDFLYHLFESRMNEDESLNNEI